MGFLGIGFYKLDICGTVVVEEEEPEGAPETTYYFNAYDEDGEEWGTHPENMVDGSVDTDASTISSGDVQLLTANEGDGTDLGTINKVELRVYGHVGEAAGQKVWLRPVFSGGDGDNHQTDISDVEGWSNYIDITSDTNAPEWDFDEIKDLDCDVWFVGIGLPVQVSKVEVRING